MAQCRFDSPSHGFRAAHSPEVHEKQARLLGQHMAVQRCDFYAMFFECGDHRIDFLRRQHEIAGCRNLAGASFLKLIASATPCAAVNVMPWSVIAPERGIPKESTPPPKWPFVPNMFSMVFTNAGGS